MKSVSETVPTASVATGGGTGAAPLLEVNKLTVGYGGTPVVQDLSIAARAGQLTAIVGPNGAGKSTLLKGIVGVLRPTSGSIHLDGEDITQVAPDDLIRHGLAYVPQVANVFPSMTVRENIELGGYIRKGEVQTRIDELCTTFPDLRPALGRQARTLSGGQRMMLALARGLFLDPKLVILDEPTAGLAPLVVETVWNYVLKIRESGAGVLVVEQNTRRSLRDADWGYVLTQGRNNLEGPGPDLLADEALVRLYIGGANQPQHPRP